VNNEIILMTIRDEIVFYDRDDATRFMQFLRSKNITTGIRINTELMHTTSINGTPPAFITFLQKRIDELSSHGDTCDDDTCQEIHEEYDDDEDFFYESYSMLLSLVKKQHDFLETFFSVHTIGEKIDLPQLAKTNFPDAENLFSEITEEDASEVPLTGRESEDADEEHDEHKESSDLSETKKETIYGTMFLMTTLVENEVLVPEDGFFVYQNAKNPDDMFITIPASFFSDEDVEALSEEQFKTKSILKDTISFTVTIGPEFFMLDDISDITRFLYDEDLDCDEDDIEHLEYGLYNRQMIGYKMIDLVKENGKMSREEIIEGINNTKISVDSNTVLFHLSDTFAGGIVDDLRKMGILKGKDAKLRLQI